MKQLRPTLRFACGFALLLVLQLSALPIHPTETVSQSVNPTVPQQSTPSQAQNKTSAEGLAEASQLSFRVVRLFDEKKFEEALVLAKRVLELRTSALGADHETVQLARLNLVEIYTAMKKYDEALKLVEGLLKSHESNVGPDDAGAAIFLDKLSFLAFMERDYDKSEASLRRALAIREKAFGKDHAEFATSLYSLAEFYRLRGKFEKAQPLYEQAAILRRKLLGHEHPEYLKVREKYSCLVYETRGVNPEKAVKDFDAKVGDPPDSSEGDTSERGVLDQRTIFVSRSLFSLAVRSVGAQKRIVIKVTIDELGKVTEASDLCSGNPHLVRPSMQVAREMTFTPTKVAGKPVKVTGVIIFNFAVR